MLRRMIGSVSLTKWCFNNCSGKEKQMFAMTSSTEFQSIFNMCHHFCWKTTRLGAQDHHRLRETSLNTQAYHAFRDQPIYIELAKAYRLTLQWQPVIDCLFLHHRCCFCISIGYNAIPLRCHDKNNCLSSVYDNAMVTYTIIIEDSWRKEKLRVIFSIFSSRLKMLPSLNWQSVATYL